MTETLQGSDRRRGTVLPVLEVFRTKSRLTKSQLATRAGISIGTINRAENGEPVRDSSITKIARALSVDVYSLQDIEPPDDINRVRGVTLGKETDLSDVMEQESSERVSITIRIDVPPDAAKEILSSAERILELLSR